jgi:hypothetical protein
VSAPSAVRTDVTVVTWASVGDVCVPHSPARVGHVVVRPDDAVSRLSDLSPESLVKLEALSDVVNTYISYRIGPALVMELADAAADPGSTHAGSLQILPAADYDLIGELSALSPGPEQIQSMAQLASFVSAPAYAFVESQGGDRFVFGETALERLRPPLRRLLVGGGSAPGVAAATAALFRPTSLA